MQKHELNLKVNGTTYQTVVDAGDTLLHVLREKLNFTGAKQGCDGTGECGACTILIQGKAVNSCLVLAMDAVEKEIVTIEGLAKGTDLHPVQQAFLDYGAVQCGFCTAGMILTTKALLDENPNPANEDIIAAIRGNLCRCTGYVKIVEAIEHAAENYGKKEI